MFDLIAAFLKWLAAQMQGPQRLEVPDSLKLDSLPDTKTKVVDSVMNAPGEAAAEKRRWYMTAPMQMLLATIRAKEAGKAGYNADYANDDRWSLTRETFDKVYTLSRSQVVSGEPSSAIGGYQFLSKTLMSLKQSLGLKGSEVFNETLQDDLAVALMIRRGLMRYLRGEITTESFCNALAKEWASLPIVNDLKRGKRWIRAGQSYYAGDGLNKAFHKPEAILKAVKGLRLSLANRMPKGDTT